LIENCKNLIWALYLCHSTKASGRRWIASDISRIAVEVTKGCILRLLKSDG